jgi:uncharacterized protein (TIGR02246 family)
MNIKLLTAFAALALFVFNVVAYGAYAQNAHAEDEGTIRENVKMMETGWNAKKGELFAKPFTLDADYVVINGMYFQGRAAIGKAHQQIFDTFHKNTTISLSVRQIRFLRPDVALVHVSGRLEGSENGKQFVSNASMTMVMTREKEGWKIAAFQNTEVVASPRR